MSKLTVDIKKIYEDEFKLSETTTIEPVPKQTKKKLPEEILRPISPVLMPIVSLIATTSTQPPIVQLIATPPILTSTLLPPVILPTVFATTTPTSSTAATVSTTSTSSTTTPPTKIQSESKIYAKYEDNYIPVTFKTFTWKVPCRNITYTIDVIATSIKDARRRFYIQWENRNIAIRNKSFDYNARLHPDIIAENEFKTNGFYQKNKNWSLSSYSNNYSLNTIKDYIMHFEPEPSTPCVNTCFVF